LGTKAIAGILTLFQVFAVNTSTGKSGWSIDKTFFYVSLFQNSVSFGTASCEK
jgi:hypothetical protein